MTKLVDTDIKDITNRLAKCEKQEIIAQDHNISQNRVSQLKKEHKHLVEQAKSKLLSKVPDILETVEQDIINNQTISTKYSTTPEDVTTIDIAYKTILQKQNTKILESIGILETRTNAMLNTGTVNITQNNITPSVTSLIADSIANKLDNVIDIESNES